MVTTKTQINHNSRQASSNKNCSADGRIPQLNPPWIQIYKQHMFFMIQMNARNKMV